MSNEVTQAKTLQERVGARIRDQIGDLMTDEDLKTLVDKALHEAFFTRTPIEKRLWNEEQKYADAFAVAHVKELLKSRVDAACKAWLTEHADQLDKHIKEAIGNGFAVMFQSWLDQRMAQTLFTFGEQFKQSLQLR
jgi:hypothetical protein